MLVLTRREDERILIGNDISVMVVEIRGDRVKLGIVAPDEVEIDREELRRRKAYESRQKPPE